MSRLTRDGTTEPVSRDQILRRERGQGNIHFPCSSDHEQDWQPYPVDPYSCYMCDYKYIHTYILSIVVDACDIEYRSVKAPSLSLAHVVLCYALYFILYIDRQIVTTHINSWR